MRIKTFIELNIVVDADYTPARPAPACQDHDSPHFSDSGDDEVMEITAAWFIAIDSDGGSVYVPVPAALMDHVCSLIDGDVTDQCRDEIEKFNEEDA